MKFMARAICFFVGVLAVLSIAQDRASAQLPLRVQLLSNLPGNPIGEEIKKMDIMDRPNRIGHFYGNTVRRRSTRFPGSYGNMPSATPTYRYQPTMVTPQDTVNFRPTVLDTNGQMRAVGMSRRETRTIQIGVPQRGTLQR